MRMLLRIPERFVASELFSDSDRSDYVCTLFRDILPGYHDHAFFFSRTRRNSSTDAVSVSLSDAPDSCTVQNRKESETLKLQELNCARCGANLAYEPGKHLTRCGYCNGSNLLVSEDDSVWYSIRELVTRKEASDLAEFKLSNVPFTPSDLLSECIFEKPQLFFVPCYEITGIRLCTSIAKKMVRYPTSHPQEVESRNYEYKWQPVIHAGHVDDQFRMKRMTFEKDTRITMNDIHMYGLAVNLPHWGLEALNLKKLRQGPDPALLESFDIRLLQKRGTVISPSKTSVQFKKIDLGVAGDQGITGMITTDTEMNLIFYPVWRITAYYHSTPYHIIIDGISGEILYCRLPMSERSRVIAFLSGVGFLGVSAGLIASRAGDLLPFAGIILKLSLYAYFFILFIVITILSIVSFSWIHLRYPAEIIINGNKSDVVYVGKHGKTLPERLLRKAVDLGNRIHWGG
jgi:hypothetical protein